MRDKINPLQLSYPTFVLGQIINPDEANQNNSDITNKVNEFVTEIEDALVITENAETKASQAVTTSNQANTTANSANTKADNSVLVANQAKTTADGAKTTAENVQADYTVIKPELEKAINDSYDAILLVEETIAGTIFNQVGAVTKLGKFVVNIDGANNFEVPFAIYSPLYDFLEISYKGIILEKNINYTTSGRIITLLFDLKIGEEIIYRVSKNQMMPENFADGAWLANDSVPKTALKSSVQNTLNNFDAHDNNVEAHGDIRESINDLADQLGNSMTSEGGTFTGIVTAHSNTSYTVRQVRNIILSTVDADVGVMQDGDIWIKYV